MYKKIVLISSFILVNMINTVAVAGTFQDNNNGTVTDLATGLIWQQSDDGVERDYATALAYCAGLSLGGSANWRLPEVKELSSLVDYAKNEVTIDRIAFPSTVGERYSSATSLAIDPSNRAWAIRFNSGIVSDFSKITNLEVRCVR